MIHLSAIDVDSLIKGAQTSIQLSDDGEAFAEEAYAILSDVQIDQIEEEYQDDIESFFVHLFTIWDEGEPNELPIILMDALADLDIEMTFDEPGEYFEEDEWDDDYDRELGGGEDEG